MSHAEDELNSTFDLATGPLARVVYFAPAGAERRAEILLTMQHVIVDAASATRLTRELLALCAQLKIDGIAPEVAPMPLPPPAESRVPARFRGWGGAVLKAGFMLRQMAAEPWFQWRSRGKRRPKVHPGGRARILPMQLPAPITSALVRQCRRRRVTLNSALSAAMLRVVQRRLYGGKDQSLRHFVIADLRPFLVPPLEADNLGSYFAMLRFSIPVSRGDDFWDLAREIGGQVYRAAEKGEKFLNLLMTRALMKTMLGLKRIRMGHTALSYGGGEDLPTEYGPLRVIGLHGFVSNFPVGPEYAAQVSLFDGRLWWDFVYLDCDMDAQTARDLAQEIFAELEVQTNGDNP